MTRAEFFRFRTGVSGLTDDQLLLLDTLFEYPGAGAHFLEMETFGQATNLPVTPDFTDADTQKLFDNWRRQGILTDHEYDEDDGSVRNRLSNRGYALWEAERLPVWDRYYETWWYFEHGSDCPASPRLRHGQQMLVVTSPSRRVASSFLRSGRACGRILPIKRWRVRRLANWQPGCLDGRRFSRAWQFYVRVRHDHGLRHIDWQRFRREQIGWIGITELIELRLDGKIPWPG